MAKTAVLLSSVECDVMRFQDVLEGTAGWFLVLITCFYPVFSF
jgi:hypothetical protein